MKDMFKKYGLAAIALAFVFAVSVTTANAATLSDVELKVYPNDGLVLTLKSDIPLDLGADADVTIKYFKDGEPILNKTAGTDLIKDKTWDGYLKGVENSIKYSKGTANEIAFENLIPENTLLTTQVKDVYVDIDWTEPATYKVEITVTDGVNSAEATAEAVVEDPSVKNVSNQGDFEEALENEAVKTITLSKDIEVNAALVIDHSVTIEGNRNTITATSDGDEKTNNYAVITITGEEAGLDDVTINNLVVNAAGHANRHGINILDATGIMLDNVTVENSTRAGMIVNGSEVTINDVTTSNNGWGGINVDKTGAHLTVTGTSKHSEAKAALWVDDSAIARVTDEEGQYNIVTTDSKADYYLDTTVVNNEAELQAAIANTHLETIEFGDDIDSDTAVLVNREVTIDGKGYTLELNNDEDSTGITTGLGVFANLDLTGLTITTTNDLDDNLVEIDGASTVATFENVTVQDSKKAGILVLDGAKLVLKGSIKLLENSWGGIEVKDTANTSVSFTGVSSFDFSLESGTPAVWIDADALDTASTHVTGAAATLTAPVRHTVDGDVPTYQVWWDVNTPNPTATVITNSLDPVTVTVAENGGGSTLDLRAVQSDDTATTSGSITVNSGVAGGNTAMVISAGTEISGDNWDGIIELPAITTTSARPELGSRETVDWGLVISVGSDTPLTFNQAVSLTLPGQTGMKVGFAHEDDDNLTEITTTCVEGAIPSDAQECKMDVDGDLVVLTKHFTTFATYEVDRRSSGGGSSGGRIASAITPVVTTAPIAGEVLGASDYTFTLMMKVGSRGNEVMELQKLLNAGNFGVLSVDGIFGPMTKAAVMAFQRANLLSADGIVGPITRAALNK